MPPPLRCHKLARTFGSLPPRCSLPELAGALGRAPVPHAAAAAAAAAERARSHRRALELRRAQGPPHRHAGAGARATRPAVLLAHGWGGYAAQMRGFVFPLLAAGYRVIAYDQPAHGVSEGKLTGLPDFADVLAAVAWHHGDVQARDRAFARRGAARALALARGLRAATASCSISPPSDLVGYSRRFARWHWIPEPRAPLDAGRDRGALRRALGRARGARASRRASRARALVIHDRDDRMVPWTQGARVARHWPGARLHQHRRARPRPHPRDEGVAHAAADFIAGRSAVASVAAPAVPRPAPSAD